MLNLKILLPELVILSFILVSLIGESLLKNRKYKSVVLVLTAILVTFLSLFLTEKGFIFNHLFNQDLFSQFFKILFLISVFLLFLFFSVEANTAFSRQKYSSTFVLIAILGVLLIVSSGELVTIFISGELVNLAFFWLLIWNREKNSNFLILSLLFSGFFLLGIVLLFGLTGSSFLVQLKRNLISNFFASGTPGPGIFLAILLITVGLSSKIGLFPFHFQYLKISRIESSFLKFFIWLSFFIIGFGALNRIFWRSLTLYEIEWKTPLLILCSLSMLWGSLALFFTRKTSSFLFYWGIIFAGILLTCLSFLSPQGAASGLFSSIPFIASFIGLGFIISILASQNTDSIPELFNNLFKQSKFLTLLTVIFLFCLIGIPATGGFIGKYDIFLRLWNRELYTVSIIIILSSLLTLLATFPVFKSLFQKKNGTQTFKINLISKLILTILALTVISTGIFPKFLFSLALKAVLIFPF